MIRSKLKGENEVTIYERLETISRLIGEIRESESKDDMAAYAADAESEIEKAKAQLVEIDRTLTLLEQEK